MSLAFTLMAGKHNASLVLPVMFCVWVVSPFGALLWAALRARAGPAVWILSLLLAVLAPLIYGVVVLGPPRAQPASAFLIVPLVSWVLIGVIWLITLRGR